ncbi:hypothetical protein [Streptomyces sp. KR55]
MRSLAGTTRAVAQIATATFANWIITRGAGTVTDRLAAAMDAL